MPDCIKIDVNRFIVQLLLFTFYHLSIESMSDKPISPIFISEYNQTYNASPSCYYLLCILTSEHMLAHAFTWSKMMKNMRKWLKSIFFILRTRGSCKAPEEKWRRKFVGQWLRVTPKSWLTPKRWLLIWFFCCFWLYSYMSLSWDASIESCTREKIPSFFFLSLSCVSCARDGKDTFLIVF